MERNTLMAKCYPRIKDYCREKHGLEFQVCTANQVSQTVLLAINSIQLGKRHLENRANELLFYKMNIDSVRFRNNK